MSIDDTSPSQQGTAPEVTNGCPFQRWREDFPINWEADHYVTRRELTKFLTLGSCLLAGANAAIAFIGHRARRGEAKEMRIGAASALPSGGSMLFRYPTDEDPCILVREQNGELRAYSQVCTHLSCAVVYEPGENRLFCPCHHGAFSITEGRPIAGPPTRPLPRIKVEERGDEIFAVGVEI
jgi:nitrite reductase/ring-hydroxylating ferredoxin subunit